MKFTDVKGDLFTVDASTSLCHCISEDCRMGKGIAVQFKNKFGGVDRLREQVASGRKTGKVTFLVDGERFIYYLITKPKYYDKPTYTSLQRSLEDMKQHMIANNVRKLAMPRIGCGLDGLDWEKVTRVVKNVFADTDIDIFAYYL